MDAPFVDIHTHRPSAEEGCVALACVEPGAIPRPPPRGTFFCCGVHPWDASASDAETRFRALRDLVDEKRLAALGETGFDRVRRQASMEAQVRLFRLHAELAESAGLPLILHGVRSNADILAEFSRLRPRSTWIVHGFSAGPQELERILSKGIAVSMGPRELSRSGAGETLRRIPSGLLFLETDASSTPLAEVYRTAAELLGHPVGSLARRIHDNWLALFGGTTGIVT